MMSVFKQLHPASFNDVPFLIEVETKTGGKKTVTHEFINSDKRYTEELGKLPPKFSIEAIIHGDGAIQNRLNLEKELEKEGQGFLVHPVYGGGFVAATTYTVSSNQTKVGEFRFSINFEKSAAAWTASPDIDTPSAVKNDADTARDNLDNALGDNYSDPDTPVQLSGASSKWDNIYGEVYGNISSVTGQIQSKAAVFTNVINDARAQVNTIVQSAVTVKQTIKDVYSAALSVVNTPADLYEAWERLIDFGFFDSSILGSIDIFVDTNTTYRQKTENNKSISSEHTRITALVGMMESAAYTEYETDQELLTVMDDLNDHFNRIVNNYQEDIPEGLIVLVEDTDTRQALFALRITTKKVLDQKLQNVWRVTTIIPGESSLALVAYKYFSNLDNLDLLQGLNPGINHANFKANTVINSVTL